MRNSKQNSLQKVKSMPQVISREQNLTTKVNEELLNKTMHQLKNWNLLSNMLRTLHLTFGLIGIICPFLVASFADEFDLILYKIIAFIGALSITIFWKFDIGTKANNFRQAWKILDIAYTYYLEDPSKTMELARAKEKGEKIIGSVNPNPFGD